MRTKLYTIISFKLLTIVSLCGFQGNSGANGRVWLEGGVGIPTRIHGVITGLSPGRHGLHVHEYGNLIEGCKTAGGHYNPYGATHGGPNDEIEGTRHVGDLGNIVADSTGVAAFSLCDSHVKLYGPYSVIGRAIVCHAGEDDLGRGNNEESLKTGNAGARVCCGVIGLAYEGPDKDEVGII